ncbi:hypothetical protein PT2222_180099 [Paraburkholderia tropica]
MGFVFNIKFKKTIFNKQYYKASSSLNVFYSSIYK